MSGVLLTPDGWSAKKSHPLIVWLHGGPYRQTSAGYHPFASYGVYDYLLELLRRNGFVVAKLDYAGSFGYGRTFAQSLKKNVGYEDVIDVQEAVGALKAKMKVGEIYTMGPSYGGYLALRTLAGNMKGFTGAISINGVTDWAKLIERDHGEYFSVQFGGAPKASNAKLYAQASIVSRLAKADGKRVMLAYGENDTTVLNRQTTEFAALLAEKNIFLRTNALPDTGHTIERADRLTELCEAVFGFLNITDASACRS